MHNADKAFGAPIATLTADELSLAWPQRLCLASASTLRVGFLYPHTQRGYWHLSVADEILRSTVHTKIAVSSDTAIRTLRHIAGSEFGDFFWRSEGHSTPTPRHPTCGHGPRPVVRKLTGADVYFIQAKTGGPIKIGCTYDVDRRFDSIQNMCPFTLQLLGVVRGLGDEGERELHASFATDRLHGEWFRDTPELLAYIQENAHR